MRIFLTGASSGVGHRLFTQLTESGNHVVAPTRAQLDLSVTDQVINYELDNVDMLINCAGTGVGGKIDFCNHRPTNVVEILNTNLIGPVLLCQKVLSKNSHCKIVNITSTNNKRYYANNLAYSLSKKALADFGAMLAVEYPNINYLEIQLGLVKTNFNNARYRYDQDRFEDIYTHPHLTVSQAVDRIIAVLFDTCVKFIEVSP